MADTIKGGAALAFKRFNPTAWLRVMSNNDLAILTTNDVPTSGASGTGFGKAGKGCLLININAGTLYQNTGTKTSPTWTLIEAAGLIPLANGSFFVGNVSGLAAAVAPSGDVTFDNTGAFAIGASKVLTANIAALAVTTAKIALAAIGSAQLDPSVIQTATGSISAANIIGTSAGQLGHANGVVLVAAPGAGKIAQLISAVFAMDFLTAAYTGGGNTTVNISGGGAALTGLVSNANFIQVASDKIIEFVPLAATFNNYGTGNNGLALVSASAPTNPGTAAGIINWQVNYRIIPSLLD